MPALSVIGVDPGERSGAAARLSWDPSGRWVLAAWGVWEPVKGDEQTVLVRVDHDTACPVRDWLIAMYLTSMLGRAQVLSVEVARGGPKVHVGVHRARGAWRGNSHLLQHGDWPPVDVSYHRWRAEVGAPGDATAGQVTAHALQWASEEIEGFAAAAKSLPRKALRGALAEACAIGVVGAS